MKQKILTLAMLLIAINIYAQNSEPQAVPFVWGNSVTARQFDIDDPYFKQTEFLTGFQWGHTPKMQIGLNNNASSGHCRGNINDNLYSISTIAIEQPGIFTGEDEYLPFRIAPAMYYEPTLIVSNPNILNTRPNDPTNAVFGFKNRYQNYGFIPINSNDINYNRMIYYSNTFPEYRNEGFLVLSNISEQPNFRTELGTGQNGGYRGHRWFLSVNLRRLSDSYSRPGEKLLTIKVKYKTTGNGSTGNWNYIQFDSIPVNNSNAYTNLPLDRGIQQNKVKVTNSTTELVVTNSMFNADNENRTITASFLTIRPSVNNEYEPANKSYLINPEFIPGIPRRDYTTFKGTYNPDQYGLLPLENIARINQLDIEVYCHGSKSIAVDYIKIESENAYYLSRGYVDSYATIPNNLHYIKLIGDYNYPNQYDTSSKVFSNTSPTNKPVVWDARMFGIKEIIQGWVTRLKNDVLPNGLPKNKPFRIYTQDTESENPNLWWQLRYANLITNGLCVTRDNIYKPTLYKYYTKSGLRYIGIKLAENEYWIGNPFAYNIQQSVPEWKTLKMRTGREFTVSIFQSWDPDWYTRLSLINHLNSNYETTLKFTLDDGYAPDQPAYEIVKSIYNALPDTMKTSAFKLITSLNIKDSNHCKLFFDMCRQTSGLQLCFEEMLLGRLFYKSEVLYSNDPWYMNYFVGTDLNACQDPSNDSLHYLSPVFGTGRPKTGEEIRLLFYASILKGGKGIFYDREDFCQYIDKNLPSNTYKIKTPWYGFHGVGFGDSVNLQLPIYPTSDTIPFNQYNSIKKENIGNDFVNPTYDPFNVYPFMALNQIAQGLSVPANHIYLGVRSTRTEIYKIQSIIRRLEQNKRNKPSQYPYDLMGLRLTCWLGKGFTKVYSQHPSLPTDYQKMNSYINMNAIRTAKLYQPIPATSDSTPKNVNNIGYNNTPNRFESVDSAFYDITILTPKDKPVDYGSLWYLGVQNRRTDPSIWDTASAQLKFYSTAEFEDSCFVSNDSTRIHFRDYFWKRLGCRMFSIWLNSSYGSGGQAVPPGYSFGTSVQEILASDTAFNNTNNRWRDTAFCHRLNMLYPYTNGNNLTPRINAKFLPGEGKLFKIETHVYQVVNPPGGPGGGFPGGLAFKPTTQISQDSTTYDIYLEQHYRDFPDKLGIAIFNKELENIEVIDNENQQAMDYYFSENEEKKASAVLFVPDIKQNEQKKIGTITTSNKSINNFTFKLLVVDEKNKPMEQEWPVRIGGAKPKIALNRQIEENLIKVIPNPAKSQAALEIDMPEYHQSDISIYDTYGKEILSYPTYNLNYGRNIINLNLNHFTSGVYNVVIKIDEQIITKRFTVIK